MTRRRLAVCLWPFPRLRATLKAPELLPGGTGADRRITAELSDVYRQEKERKIDR